MPISKSGNLTPHTYLTVLLNRHFVKKELRADLDKVADKLNRQYPNLRVSYLDANFPFWDGFPLLPHLSHDDGRKVDLSFFYTKDEKSVNLKPTRSGYGIFVEPKSNERNQNAICKAKGHWQYDITKYVKLGSRNDLEFDPSKTRLLMQKILEINSLDKIFIEPHLKTRLKLNSSKIRFHGCHAVRHDDHIHLQIR